MGGLELGAAGAARSYSADLGEGALSKNSTGQPPHEARAAWSGRGRGGSRHGLAKAASAADSLSLAPRVAG